MICRNMKIVRRIRAATSLEIRTTGILCSICGIPITYLRCLRATTVSQSNSIFAAIYVEINIVVWIFRYDCIISSLESTWIVRKGYSSIGIWNGMEEKYGSVGKEKAQYLHENSKVNKIFIRGEQCLLFGLFERIRPPDL